MHEVELVGAKILLIRQDGVVSGFSGKCTHYGAPLVKGALTSNRIICPWHGACFNSKTGDIEDFPGLSSLVKYRVEERGGDVWVLGDRLDQGRREQYTNPREVTENSTVVVVGGGAAGHTALETFRNEGYGGRLVLLTAENTLPYDRPKLSKKLDVQLTEIQLRDNQWFKDSSIEVRLGTTVSGLDTVAKQMTTSTGEKINYDKILLATGSSPRKLGVDGEELEGVRMLRSPSDANYIYNNCAGKEVVIVGGSFIGMEVAAAIVEKCERVTVIDRNAMSFQSSFGDEVGQILHNLHKEKGVNFEFEEVVKEMLGSEGKVTRVILGSGKELAAELVVVGVGTIPNTNLLTSLPDALDSRGFLQVDEYMQSGLESVWAAGDIVKFPLLTFNKELVSIGHWGLAMYMGKIAALNIMGKQSPALTVPFFWSVQYGKSVRFAGTMTGTDSVKVHTDQDTFLATYSKGGVVRGVATLGRDPAAAVFNSLVLEGGTVREEEALTLLLPK